MANVRRDVASFGNGWSPDLEWYARAVGALSAKPISDPTSWAALAALHGIDASGWQAVGILPSGPLPAIRPEWNQCQHGNWFFPPWHRGYLASFEAIVAKTIAELGGPDDWTLPYWNYLDTTNPSSRKLPDVFTVSTLSDGTSNPLAMMLYGAVAGTPWPRQFMVLAPHPPMIPSDISLKAMRQPNYTASPGAQGFGGSPTANGELERNPHNLVHIMIGGVSGNTGFMSDPDYAALDPIFWLHHCNIDRLWEAWLSVSSNTQENGAAWSGGPLVPQFTLPDPAGQFRSFKPGDTLPGQPLAPVYDDLHKGTGVPAPTAGTGAAMPASLSSGPPTPATLLGANVTNAVVAPGATVSANLGLASPAAIAGVAGPVRYYLNVENVRGECPSGLLAIHIGVKAKARTVPSGGYEYVDSLPLFGLKKASDPNGPHSGDGLNMVLDITDAVTAVLRRASASLDDLEVSITQPASGEGTAPISVGRISVYGAPDQRR